MNANVNTVEQQIQASVFLLFTTLALPHFFNLLIGPATAGLEFPPTILFILSIHASGGQALLKPDLTANEREFARM